MFIIGEAVKSDEEKAFTWWSKAAAQGYAGSYVDLARIFENQHGNHFDPSRAEKLYLAAVESHKEDVCATASNYLGWLYGKTYLVDGAGAHLNQKPDAKKALYWFYQARYLGFPADEQIRSILKKTGVRISDLELEQWKKDYLNRR